MEPNSQLVESSRLMIAWLAFGLPAQEVSCTSGPSNYFRQISSQGKVGLGQRLTVNSCIEDPALPTLHKERPLWFMKPSPCPVRRVRGSGEISLLAENNEYHCGSWRAVSQAIFSQLGSPRWTLLHLNGVGRFDNREQFWWLSETARNLALTVLNVFVNQAYSASCYTSKGPTLLAGSIRGGDRGVCLQNSSPASGMVPHFIGRRDKLALYSTPLRRLPTSVSG